MSQDDLNYKIEFQAILNEGVTAARLEALDRAAEHLVRTNQILPETYEEIAVALREGKEQLANYAVSITQLSDDTEAMANFQRNAAAATREKAAADKQAAAQEKERAAQAKATAAEEAKALREQEAAAKAALSAQKALNDQSTRASTLASRTSFNALSTGASAVTAAGNRLPRLDLSGSADPSVLRYNQELYALFGRLQQAQLKYRADIRGATSAYKEQVAVAQEASGGVVSAANMAAIQERYRQEIARATIALKDETTEATALGKQLQVNAERTARAAQLNNMGTTSRGGGGASFAALYLQQQFIKKISDGLMGTGADAIKTAATYEQAFADVSRTTEIHGKDVAGGIEAIRQGLMKLDTEVPLSFADLSKIAAMGNELGVNAGSILSFSKTVAEYSTVTGTSAEQTANDLGSLNEILHLSGNEYTNLGSAISYVGRMSVASEPQIVAMLDQMASTGEQARLTKQEVIGLAGAFASVKIAPEAARSAMQAYTKTLNDALAGGTKHGGIAEWGKILGMSPEDASHLAQTNGNAFMQKFLETLHGASSVGKTRIFEDLGLNNTRTTNAFTRLSGSVPMLKNLLDDANVSWAKGNDLTDQAAKKNDTLIAKYNELKNAVSNLLADMGNSGLQGELKIIAAAFIPIVKGIDTFVKQHPRVTTFILTFAGLAGAILAVRAAMLAVEVAAKAFTFFEAANTVEITGFGSALKALGVQMGLIKVSGGLAKSGGEDAARGLATAAGAMETVGKAAPGAEAGLLGVGVAAEEAGAEVGIGARIAGIAIMTWEGICSLGTTLIIGALIALVTYMITDFGGAMKFAGGVVGFFGDALSGLEGPVQFVDSLVLGLAAVVVKVAEAVVAAAGAMAAAFHDMASANTLNGMRDSLDRTSGALGNFSTNSADMSKKLDEGRKQIKDAGAALDKWGTSLKKQQDAALNAQPDNKALNDELKRSQDELKKAGLAAGNTGGDLGKLGSGAKGAAEQVRTLADYSSDLSGVLNRAFDLQFGAGQAKDAVTSQFLTMKQNALQAAQAVKTTQDSIAKLRAEMSASQADLQRQKYFMSVASTFGDTLRMGQIQAAEGGDQAAIAGDKTQMTSDQAQLAEDQDKATQSLAGNTAGAIANRAALTDLAQKYQDYIAKLAASGMNQRDLTRKTDEAKKEFIRQATQLGYNKDAVNKVASAFDNMKLVIAGVPRNITISVSKNAAIEALKEFEAKAKSTAAAAKSALGGIGGFGVPTTPSTPSKGDRELAIRAAIRDLSNVHYNNVGQNMEVVAELDRYREKLYSGSYAEGGYTGPGGKYEPAGIVHRGEYVVPAQYVNQTTGLPSADALGRLVTGMQPANNGYSSGGYVNPGMQVMELGPKSLAAVRDVARQEVVAHISASNVASAVNSNNRNTRRRGGG